MRRALEYVKAFGGVIAQHAEEPRLTVGAQMNEGIVSGRLGLTGWPAAAEEAIIARDALLTGHVDSRLHICHVSTAGSVEILRWAKGKGWNVTAEVTPHHLILTDSLGESYDPVYKVNPPLRTAEDIEALRAGLADGTIDCVATDHAPHAAEDKETEWGAAAPGMLGLQTALSVVVETMVATGRLTWRELAARMSTAPALIGGLAEHGRPIAVGEPANLVLIDPDGAVDRRPVRARVEVAQHPVRRPDPAGDGGPDPPAWADHRPGRRRFWRGDPVWRGRHAKTGGSVGMIRLLLVLACLVFFAVCLTGMRVGWRHRAARQDGIGGRPAAPVAIGEPLLAPMSGLYVGTTRRGPVAEPDRRR